MAATEEEEEEEDDDDDDDGGEDDRGPKERMAVKWKGSSRVSISL